MKLCNGGGREFYVIGKGRSTFSPLDAKDVGMG